MKIPLIQNKYLLLIFFLLSSSLYFHWFRPLWMSSGFVIIPVPLSRPLEHTFSSRRKNTFSSNSSAFSSEASRINCAITGWITQSCQELLCKPRKLSPPYPSTKNVSYETQGSRGIFQYQDKQTENWFTFHENIKSEIQLSFHNETRRTKAKHCWI